MTIRTVDCIIEKNFDDVPGLFFPAPAGFLDKGKQWRNYLSGFTFSFFLFFSLKSHGQILHIYCRCKIISRFQPFTPLY